MSVAHFERTTIAPIALADLDSLLAPLSPIERQDVRSVVVMVTKALATRSDDLRAFRLRMDAVIAGLIDVVDAIDGDADRKQTTTEAAGRGFRLDPLPDDAEDSHDRAAGTDYSGLGDWHGRDEQMARTYPVLLKWVRPIIVSLQYPRFTRVAALRINRP